MSCAKPEAGRSGAKLTLRGRGFPVVISAPSGAGKTSICRGVRAAVARASYSVSVTTRAMRPGEVDGRDYHFVNRAEFEKRIGEGRFVEWAEVHGNLYGTDRRVVRAGMEKGEIVLLDIDVQGGAQLKAKISETVSIFVLPPSWAALEERLRGRGDESDEAVRLRLRNARKEAARLCDYDYIVVNDDLDRATREVANIVRSEGCRESRLEIDGLDLAALPADSDSGD
ncbi:MAG: guanylate kinase [Gemmatimonadetes bacterium]|nr:guanylate kinase [Gemmatimonadota bacterium]